VQTDGSPRRDETVDIVQDAMFKQARNYGSRPGVEWRPRHFRILADRITDQQRRHSVCQRAMDSDRG
jgi:DNA-directed RNA polymerase specialized sigma24 family protein